jgi:ABC-type transport system involved in multi-copper enzyme maturation permease subunit
MVIHDRSYSRWKGDRNAPVPATSVIFEAAIKRAAASIFRRKIPAVLLILLGFGPFLFFFGAMLVKSYVVGNAAQYPEFAEALQSSKFGDMLSWGPNWVYFYMFLWQWPLVLLTCILVGSGLVAEDRRANALEMYLSRPVTVRQYLGGKFAAIAFYVALVTVIPATILGLTQLSVSWQQPGEFTRLAGVILRTIVGGAVWVAVPSLTILAASSLADRARNAAILWLGVVVMLEFVASNILQAVFQVDAFYLLQIGFNVRQVLNWVLDNQTDLVLTVPVWASALVLAGWVLLCLRILTARVKPVEVVA